MWNSIKSFFASMTGWFKTHDVADEVMEKTVDACGFLPTAATVVNIVAAGNPSLMTATAIAGAICAAVTPKHPVMGLYEPVPMVAGVPIEGTFIKKGA